MNERRYEFPLLQQNLIYLDNAATTQKPECVIRAVSDIYEHCNGNVHRSPHRLGRQATAAYEKARKNVADFFHADDTYEVIFTRGTTESINLAASSLLPEMGRQRNEVVVTLAEHHSNLVPWQQWCKRLGMKLRVVELTEAGSVDLLQLEEAVCERTAVVAMAQLTNVFGTLQPVKEAAELAHQNGAVVLVDGAQSAGHLPVSMTELGCDLFAASGHKMYGPNGIGFLIGKKECLKRMQPWQYGGEMVDEVTPEYTSFQEGALKFEAGTPDYVGAAALAKALDYLRSLGGMDCIAEHEKELSCYLARRLLEIDRIRLPKQNCFHTGIVSFVVEGMHPFDTAVMLDAQGIAVRSGMHCAQPLMRACGLEQGTVRVSLGLYNTKEEIDILADALRRIAGLPFGKVRL